MSRPLRIECYLIPLYRFWALTSECECAFSHRMPIRDATVRHSVRGAPPRGHETDIRNPPRHPYRTGAAADYFTLSRLHGGVRGA